MRTPAPLKPTLRSSVVRHRHPAVGERMTPLLALGMSDEGVLSLWYQERSSVSVPRN